MFSPAYHPPSNGIAERSVRVLKELLKRNKIGSIKTRLAKILLHYRSNPHSVTKVSPNFSLNGRELITVKSRINPHFMPSVREGKEKVSGKFNVGDSVSVLNLRSGAKWLNGTIVNICGTNMYEVYVYDLKCRWIRHDNQLLLRKHDASNVAVHESFVDPFIYSSDVSDSESVYEDANEQPPEHVNPPVLRRSTRIRKVPDRLNL